ncbi:multifunctional uroporphyrinogen III methylase/precorrin-2 oxidase/ferrochelatase [Knoellia flava TL1]|uniref:uroporphyrinogen-III C-methyltransferase n=2 Tax=Knoellia flava TaxID=913969 RepID=A0A8H9FNS9_9MICO|nr:uroporphyrinogen-III C-methyltransferase [Knoellia flava]KGN34494.1 multifunctional uroporphyrinogen III methylase/precorrin-2 oxidase/ferrochelatase [Knoellia flava TL1]GGB64870.1 uroporphyrinogen-III C-methyltransferase [Knoellia flava]
MGHLRGALPVVLDLGGRLVVALGGGPVTGERVRSFLDEGADVRVVSPWVCEEVSELLDAHTDRTTWVRRDWAGPADLDGAWLVHTATGDPGADAAVRAAADELRLWCVDATDVRASAASVPALTRVQTPDGAVTVAVHTEDDGRSARVRDSIDLALHTGALDLRPARRREQGWVALVGGGPGSDGLLTSRGHELLATADVVVVDRLAPRAVVSRLPESVRVIDVGKTPGHHPVPQDRINEILVEEASRGHGVARLKGGDPYVLGRGGEERLACEAHGIPVEVVPGVTSAVAVPAAAGIPLTHRGVAKAFTVVSGHEQIPSLPPGSDHTLVLLMGVSTLRDSATRLIAAGRSADCPVAIVERGFLPDQRVTFGTLEDIADTALFRRVESPAVVVVGDVVDLATG